MQYYKVHHPVAYKDLLASHSTTWALTTTQHCTAPSRIHLNSPKSRKASILYKFNKFRKNICLFTCMWLISVVAITVASSNPVLDAVAVLASTPLLVNQTPDEVSRL